MENRMLDNHISNVISPEGKNFHLLGIKLHAIRDHQNHLVRLWIFNYTVLCHLSYKNNIMLNAKNLSIYDKIDDMKTKN